MRKIDRNKLGLKKFWKEVKSAVKANEPVLIVTHNEDVEHLPKDLKLLLGLSIQKFGAGAVAGVGVVIEVPVLLAIIAAIVSLAVIGTVIFMVSSKYKFKVKNGADGIEIQGEPC
jgi:hypothetical protein